MTEHELNTICTIEATLIGVVVIGAYRFIMGKGPNDP